ncbi:DUF397 domain-containing protein [Streptomyces sp. NPDC002055]|uniref:DUF397 domain-containing protein n=1 Tax=Streptomyces sp. NPDC002055 TaxID=3154534 RepID=UPI0033317093
MTSRDLTKALWRRKSSHSSDTGACVEVAALPDAVAALDTKDPGGPALFFTRNGWTDFIRAVNRGEFQP